MLTAVDSQLHPASVLSWETEAPFLRLDILYQLSTLLSDIYGTSRNRKA